MPDEDGEAPQSVSLIDESGQERTFTLHDAFELEGVTYYLVEAAEDPDEVMLLRESGEGLETVDQEEFERVMTALDHDEVD
ncbi:MAG TPA: DUF1292 domain-containing protein [Candidatus Dormibacteraeota bacterium]|nr:DUF1292 domain-containing protein [Candidatus Dormibacteraeota bacterium]